MHDLHRRVNFEKSDFLARFEGDLESSGNDGRCVRLEDVMPPSETDWPSLRRFPTGEVTVVAYESLSLSFSLSVPFASAGDFSGSDAMDIAVPVIVVGCSEVAERSDWVGNGGGGSCPVLLWVSLLNE